MKLVLGFWMGLLGLGGLVWARMAGLVPQMAVLDLAGLGVWL